jgi:sugar/nucleoside kinase (ribokinase family)
VGKVPPLAYYMVRVGDSNPGDYLENICESYQAITESLVTRSTPEPHHSIIVFKSITGTPITVHAKPKTAPAYTTRDKIPLVKSSTNADSLN